ncbi:MAG TPA: hypothetical protein VD928_01335 [Candidatus Paceibacterota bacterium]|nr:hypothetical protein [Candidatus Paceibacterota bacterium]
MYYEKWLGSYPDEDLEMLDSTKMPSQSVSSWVRRLFRGNKWDELVITDILDGMKHCRPGLWSRDPSTLSEYVTYIASAYQILQDEPEREAERLLLGRIVSDFLNAVPGLEKALSKSPEPSAKIIAFPRFRSRRT